MIAKLDFTLLPDLSLGTAWYSINDDILLPMSVFPETKERAMSAVKFAWFSLQKAETLGCHDNNILKSKEAFIRASLAEFVSMEDTLRRDINYINRHDVYKINHSPNPLLHIIRELRNFEIHITTSKIKKSKRKAYWGNVTIPEDAMEIDTEILTINEIKLANFRLLRNSKLYNENDIRTLLDWFNNFHGTWGLPDLIWKAVISYLNELIAKYNLK